MAPRRLRPAPLNVGPALSDVWRRVRAWRPSVSGGSVVSLDPFDKALVARFRPVYERHAGQATRIPTDAVRPGAFADAAAMWKNAALARSNTVTALGDHAWDCAGATTSLYDRPYPGSDVRSGDPNADRFCVVTGAQFGWIVVADGVNWGVRPMAAAQAAVEGATEHMRGQLAAFAAHPSTSARDVAVALFDALMAAQVAIIAADGTLTTLCCGIAFPLASTPSGSAGTPRGLYDRGLHLPTVPCPATAPRPPTVFLCATVGDSRAFILPTLDPARGVVHVTDDGSLRLDVRDPGGALGMGGMLPSRARFPRPSAADDQPDVANLHLSYHFLSAGDLVVLCSDGIHDNLDPQIRMVDPPTLQLPWRTWTELDAAVATITDEAVLAKIPAAKDKYVAARWTELVDRARPPVSNDMVISPRANAGASSAPAAAAAAAAAASLSGAPAAAAAPAAPALPGKPPPTSAARGNDSTASRFVQAVVAEVEALTQVQRARIERANLQQPAPVPDVDESWSDEHYADVKAQHRIDLRLRTEQLNRDLETLPGKLDHATVVTMRVPAFL